MDWNSVFGNRALRILAVLIVITTAAWLVVANGVVNYQRAGDVFVTIIVLYIAIELLLLFRRSKAGKT